MVYRFALRGANVVTASAHRGCRQPQNRHACQLEIRSPWLQVATVTDLVSLAREKRPELVVE
jgi:hypothetical protein